MHRSPAHTAPHSPLPLPIAQVDRLAHEVHRRCPVASMMAASGCLLDIKWVVK